MSERTLRNRRILVVEDEYFVAEELTRALKDQGAVVVGPVSNLQDAMCLLQGGTPVDGAILDVNLADDMVYPLADRLLERNIPLVFTTGYDRSAIPARFSQVERIEKPIDFAVVVKALIDADGR